jgi:alanyl-tRNA synthetase
VNAPDGWDHTRLREIGDQLRERYGEGVFVVGSGSNTGVNLVTMVTTGPQSRGLTAARIVQIVASDLGGRGGGRADVAQGTGNDAARLDATLERVPDIVKSVTKGA